MNRSLSVVIPAYCESENILGTLESVTAALAGTDVPHEILVIDDGSSDGTGDLVDSVLHRFPSTTLLRNPRNMGFGWTYRRGVQSASLANIVMVHGDNAWGADTLQNFFRHVGEAEIVIGYTRNMWHTRPLGRTLISKTFTRLLNLITGLSLHYYNGLQIHPATSLKAMQIESTGYGFQAEVLIKGLREGKTYVEVPMDVVEREKGESKAFRFANFVDVMRTLGRLCALEWS